MAADRPWVLYQGDTFLNYFRLRGQVLDGTGKYVKGDPMDLTGYTFKAQVRSSPKSGTVLAEMSFTMPNQTDLTTRGFVFGKLTPTQTAALGPATPASTAAVPVGVYDVQMTDPGGDVTTLFSGAVTIVPDVTANA